MALCRWELRGGCRAGDAAPDAAGDAPRDVGGGAAPRHRRGIKGEGTGEGRGVEENRSGDDRREKRGERGEKAREELLHKNTEGASCCTTRRDKPRKEITRHITMGTRGDAQQEFSGSWVRFFC